MIDPKQYNSKIMGSAQESKIFDGNKCFNLYGQTRIEIRRYAQKDLLIVPLGCGISVVKCNYQVFYNFLLEKRICIIKIEYI